MEKQMMCLNLSLTYAIIDLTVVRMALWSLSR